MSNVIESIKSGINATVENVVTHSELAVETLVQWSKQGKALAGTVLLGTINALNYAEQNAPIVQHEIEVAIAKSQTLWQQTLSAALVAITVVGELVDPWKDLFKEIASYLQENGPSIYASFKSGLNNFYKTHWSVKPNNTLTAEERLEMIKQYMNEGDYITPEQIEEAKQNFVNECKASFERPKSLPATKYAGESLVIDVNTEEGAEIAEEIIGAVLGIDAKKVHLPNEDELPDSLRGLRKIVQQIGGIPGYGRMTKDELHYAVANRVRKLRFESESTPDSTPDFTPESTSEQTAE